MQPANDEQLILLYYGELEAREADALRARLAAEPELAARFAKLSADLDNAPELPVPERDEFYGRRVWARVDAALDTTPTRMQWWRAPLRLAGGALVIALVAVSAFQLGRMTPPETRLVENASDADADYSARLLEASLVNHLNGAERLLTEISNSERAAIDVEAEQDWAHVLLVANRLYRFAAEQAGQHRIAQLLADMEPVLIELANGTGGLSPDEYHALRRSIAARDLLFKVRSTNIAAASESESL